MALVTACGADVVAVSAEAEAAPVLALELEPGLA
jgi:hypothetical protein